LSVNGAIWVIVI